MEEIPSVRKGSDEEHAWRRENNVDLTNDAAGMIMTYVLETESKGGEPLTAGDIDSAEFRDTHLNGLTRGIARAAAKKLVADKKLDKAKGHRGKPTTYHKAGSQPTWDATETPAPAPTTASVASNDGRRYEGEILEDGKPRYIVDGEGYKFDRLAEINAADY